MEIATNFIAGDYEKEVTKLAISTASLLTGKLVDKALVMPNSTITSELSESTKVAKEIVKSEASNKVKEVSNNKLKGK